MKTKMKKTKQIKSIIALFVAICVSINVSAEYFTVGSFYYQTITTTTVKVYDLNNSGHCTIPSTVTYNGKTYTVTVIGPRAFKDCTGLTGVTIPSSVTTIEMNAFENSGLISVTIPGTVSDISNEAFFSCTNLKTVTIETGVVETSTRMFGDCTNLTKVTLPNTISDIGLEAFRNCSSLDTLICPRTNPPTTKTRAFNGCPSTAKVIVPCGAKSNYEDSWYYLTIVEDCETPPVVEVNVTTEEAIDIKRKSATLKGKVQTTATVSARGFQYRIQHTTTASSINAGVSTASFSCTPTDLTPDTWYDFRAFAVVDSDTTWGAWKSFTTGYINVTGQDATDITTNSATLNASVSASEGVNATIKGFEYKKTTGGTYTTVNVTGSTFSYSLTALESNTEYTFRAFVVDGDDNEKIWGEEKTFKTLKENIDITITIEDATDITAHSATLHGKIETTADVTAKGFLYKLFGNSTYAAVNATGSSLSITYNLTGLEHDTYYEFTVFAVVDNDTIKGEEWKSFLTDYDGGGTSVTVTTNDATNITTNSAKLNATVETTATITAKGFQYKTTMGGTYATVNVTKETFAYDVTGLESDTRYTFKAFAVVGTDTIFGEEKTFVTLDDSGIEDIAKENTISIYPNPAHDKVTIEGKGEVVITNSLGQVVKKINYNNATKTLNISDFERGVYYIKVGNVTTKLVIE